MRKFLFFIPAIIFTAFYGFVMIGIGLSVSPMVFIWIALFIISGILLAKNLFWGGVLGILPGCHSMYMSTIDTGQVMNIELPLGIVIVAFYLICSVYVYVKHKKQHAKS